MDDLIAALTILRKCGNPYNPTHCEHDELWVCVPHEKVTREDRDELTRLGFFIDRDTGGFKSYRFGSC